MSDGSFDRLIVVVLASSTKKRRDRNRVVWVTQMRLPPTSLVIISAQDGARWQWLQWVGPRCGEDFSVKQARQGLFLSLSLCLCLLHLLKDCATQRPGWDASCDAQDGVFVLRT